MPNYDYYNPNLPYNGEPWQYSGGFGYYGPAANTGGAAGATPNYDVVGGWQGWDSSGSGGGGFRSAAAGGGGPNLMMDTGQSSGIPGGGPGIEFPPATGFDPNATWQQYSFPSAPAPNSPGFIQASGGDPTGSMYGPVMGAGDPSGAGIASPNLFPSGGQTAFNYSPAPDGGTYVYDANWNYVQTIPGSDSGTPVTTTSTTPSAPAQPASGDLSYSNPYSSQTQQAAPTSYSGPTGFGSASTGLYSGFEGGVSTGSVGGFSGMMDSGIGGGGMGPPSVMRYL